MTKKWTPNKIDIIATREAKKLGLIKGNNANDMSMTEWDHKVEKLTHILKEHYDLSLQVLYYGAFGQGIRIWSNQPIES